MVLNKCILEHIKRSDAKVVRMYSKMVENADFPLPWLPSSADHMKNPLEVNISAEHRDIALHFLIRRGMYTEPFIGNE